MEIVSTMAQISLLAKAMGGISAEKGMSEGSQPQERQAAQQERRDEQAGPSRLTPQAEISQRSESQDFIPLSFAQTQTADEEHEAGELPMSREQMRQAGSLLQERVAREQQRQQTVGASRRHRDITAELSTERQARQTAERRLAELEAQMAGDHPPTQRVETQTGVRGRQTAPMLPRPLQIGGVAQRPMQGGRPQTAMPTYSQVAQMPPPPPPIVQQTARQIAARPVAMQQTAPPQAALRPAALRPTMVRPAAPLQIMPRTAEEMRRRQDIRQGKRPADVPRAAGVPQAAQRAQTPLHPLGGLQIGPDMAGTSHFSEDLRRYVSLLVRQYVEQHPTPQDIAGQATDSLGLDAEAMEEDRLAWQQVAAGMRQSPDEDHPMLGGRGDDAGDDWDSLEVEDFLMGEADPDHPVAMATVRQEIQQQPDLAFADRQAEVPTT